MKTVKVLKLGTTVHDKATRLPGMLTHWLMNMSGTVEYLFQPHGLDEEGQPLKRLYLCLARLEVKESDFEEVEVPFEILGTEVASSASGFKGMAIVFIRHLNGCFHIEIQPSGRSAKTGAPIGACEFDMRECIGEMIPKMDEQERKKSIKEKPSPSEVPSRRSYGE